MLRRLECCVCGEQVDLHGSPCRIRVCRRCNDYTPHISIGFVASDEKFFGYRNIDQFLELALAKYVANAEEWEKTRVRDQDDERSIPLRS